MALIEKPIFLHEARAWPGELPYEYKYTAGVAGERFLRELKDNGRIMGARCPKCDLLYVPARLYCERCLSPLEDWKDVGREGYVYSYTVMHVGLDGTPLPKPQVIALVEFEGTHGGIVHYLDGLNPEDAFIGMPVVAVLKPKSRRTGSILDIRHFRPA